MTQSNKQMVTIPYGKLVRDYMPDEFARNGHTGTFKVIDSHAYVEALRGKLAEEVDEYLRNPSVDELGDVLLVANTLVEKTVDQGEYRLAYDKKLAARGPLNTGLWLVDATIPADEADKYRPKAGTTGFPGFGPKNEPLKTKPVCDAGMVDDPLCYNDAIALLGEAQLPICGPCLFKRIVDPDMSSSETRKAFRLRCLDGFPPGREDCEVVGCSKSPVVRIGPERQPLCTEHLIGRLRGLYRDSPAQRVDIYPMLPVSTAPYVYTGFNDPFRPLILAARAIVERIDGRFTLVGAHDVIFNLKTALEYFSQWGETDAVDPIENIIDQYCKVSVDYKREKRDHEGTRVELEAMRRERDGYLARMEHAERLLVEADGRMANLITAHGLVGQAFAKEIAEHDKTKKELVQRCLDVDRYVQQAHEANAALREERSLSAQLRLANEELLGREQSCIHLRDSIIEQIHDHHENGHDLYKAVRSVLGDKALANDSAGPNVAVVQREERIRLAGIFLRRERERGNGTWPRVDDITEVFGDAWTEAIIRACCHPDDARVFTGIDTFNCEKCGGEGLSSK